MQCIFSDKSGMFPRLTDTIIIGLGHKARHGKDSAARILIEHYPALVRRYGFADDLYAVARVTKGMTAKDPVLLQTLGVEYRDRDLNTWIRSLYWKLATDQPRIAVITDVRFRNEAKFIRDQGGLLIRISRLDGDGKPFVDQSRPADHPSETDLDAYPWDTTIVNRDRQMLAFRQDVIDRVRPLIPKETNFRPY